MSSLALFLATTQTTATISLLETDQPPLETYQTSPKMQQTSTRNHHRYRLLHEEGTRTVFSALEQTGFDLLLGGGILLSVKETK